MKNKTLTIKSLICSVIAFMLLILSQFGLIALFNKPMKASAASSYDASSKISNSNFESDSDRSTYPVNPANFTAYSGNTKSSSSNGLSANVEAGVIDLTNEDFTTKFTDVNVDALHDNYVLMVSSEDAVNYGDHQ